MKEEKIMKNIRKLFFTCAVTAASVAFSQDANEDQFALLKRVRADYKNAKTNSAVYAAYMTPEKWQEYVHQICASNKIAIAESGVSNNNLMHNPTVLFNLYNSWYFSNEEDRQAYLARWDEEISSSSLYTFDLNVYRFFPKVIELFFNKRQDFVERRPVLSGIITRNPTNTFTTAEIVNKFVEDMSLGEVNQAQITIKIKEIAKRLSNPIKRYIRMQGKTFVVGEDGKNPVQDIIDEFTTAIQASKCVGVKEFCIKYLGYEDWIDVNEQDYEDLKDKIFYGEVPLNNVNAVKLQYYLGIDAYNEFIEAYNNDAK